jgi:hypothetical protein
MAVEDALISVPGTGQSLEGVAVTTPAGSDLVREGVVLSDPETAAARVKVTNAAPGSSDYGAVVRIAGPIDSVTGAVQGIEWEHSRIHSGRGFSYVDRVDNLANGSSFYWQLDNPAANYAHLRQISGAADGAPVEVRLFEAPTITGDGTQGSPKNLNRASANAANLDVYRNATVSADGEELDFMLIPGSRSVGGSGTEGVETEWILAPSTKYVIKLTNTSGGASDVGLRLFWYEGGS